MRLILLTQYFPPEVGAPQNRLFDLALQLKKLGAEVEVLTAMPNYPQMRIHEPYGRRWLARETMSGIPVIRVWLYVSQRRSIFHRLSNYFSFVATSAFAGAIKLRRADFLLCESPPLFLGISGWLLAKRAGARFIFNVSDLWPESAQRLGIVTSRPLLGLATRLEEWLYRSADLITGQTQGIVRNISSRFPQKPVHWLSNGVDEQLYRPAPVDQSWRAAHGYKADDFILLYAGIMGHAQGLEVVLRAASILRAESSIRFLMLGEGPEKARLLQETAQLGLPNLHFLPAVPKDQMSRVISSVNAAVIPLKKLDLFKGAIPSKIFETLAMEKPIILGVEGEAKELFIDEAQAGLFYTPEDHVALAAAVQTLHKAPELVRELGQNGRKFVSARFSRTQIALQFWQFLMNPGASVRAVELASSKTG